MSNGREAHELANIFPKMSQAEYKRLKDSIQEIGLLEPIILYEGKILDGRNRYQACRELGIDCCEGEFIPEEMGITALQFVLAENRDRRHLSPSQLSTVGQKLKEIYEAEAKERMREGGKNKGKENLPYPAEDSGQSRDKAGAAVGVSGKLIDFADKVAKKGTPALNAAVESDQIKVSKAAKIADLPPAEQDKIVSGESEFKPPKSKPKATLKPEPVESDEPAPQSKFTLFRLDLEALIEGLGVIEPHQWHVVGDMLTDAGEAAYSKAKTP